MFELAQEAVQSEIEKHPEMRDDILKKYDQMVEQMEEDGDSAKHYAEFIQYLDNNIRIRGSDEQR